MAAMWYNEKLGQDRKEIETQFFESLYDWQDQECQTRMATGYCNKNGCILYHTKDCLHPEKVFPNNID